MFIKKNPIPEYKDYTWQGQFERIILKLFFVLYSKTPSLFRRLGDLILQPGPHEEPNFPEDSYDCLPVQNAAEKVYEEARLSARVKSGNPP